MIGDKTLHFEGKGTDLADLQGKIEGYLKDEKFTVQTSPASDKGNVVQARKGGWLDGIIAADRALTIVIAGEPSDFTVRIGIGKWEEHLGVTAVETLLLGIVFLVVDVAEIGWNFEIENKLVKQIETFVG
jgi:hypothetical protein